MGINLAKTSHILFFVALLPGVSFGVGWGFAQIFPSTPFWVETVSPLAAYGLLYGLFEKHLWHWPVFRFLGIVVAPDVRGRWLGKQTSSFKDEKGASRESRVIMEIQQTFSGLKIDTFYKNWRTEHTIATFIEVDGECTLFIMYETTPKTSMGAEAASHKGVVRLTQQPSKKLEGTYFNAAGRGGEVSFKRTRYSLHKTFESIGT